MKLRTPLTRASLRHHLRYYGWIYLLLVGLSFALWSMIYTQTTYRPPQGKRIDLYIQSATADQDAVNAFLKPIWQEAVPDQELVSAVLLYPSGGELDYAATIQLTTYLGAGEGDIYILTSADFKRLAAQGSFVDLGPALQAGVIDATGLNLTAGQVSLVEYLQDGGMRAVGGNRQFGIPAGDLYALASELSIDNRDLVMAVAVNSGNEQASLTFLNALVQRARGPIPDFFK